MTKEMWLQQNRWHLRIRYGMKFHAGVNVHKIMCRDENYDSCIETFYNNLWDVWPSAQVIEKETYRTRYNGIVIRFTVWVSEEDVNNV